MRLAGEPPYVVARLPDEAAPDLVARLSACGCAALSVGAEPPGDEDRFLVRTLEFPPGSVILRPRAGEERRLAGEDIRLLLRGVAIGHETRVHTEKQRRLSLGKALLTQGLSITKVEKKEIQVETETADQFVLVYPDPARGRAAILYESEVAFACLGREVQPSRLANLNLVTQKLRSLAPRARFDDRLLRLSRRGGDRAPDVIAEVLWQALLQGLL